MDLKDKNDHSILMIALLQRSNFKTLRFLLKYGSNINTTDNNNNTMFHHLLFTKNPGEDVFKFLINKGIDYNIENKDGQFPISIAIEKSHDKLGFELLNMNCKIHDPKSIHEPIVEALKRNSSKWFNELINHGADAMNEKLELYLVSSILIFIIIMFSKRLKEWTSLLKLLFKWLYIKSIKNAQMTFGTWQ